MKKLLFTLAIGTLGMIATTNATVLDDAVKRGNQQGLTTFDNPTSFMASNTIRRDEAAKFFVNFSDLFDEAFDDEPEYLVSANECQFTDVDQARADLRITVAEACRLGLFKGSNGKFNPTKPITNAESIAVLIRILDDGEKQSEIGVSHWSDNYYKRAKELGLDTARFANKSTSATRGDIITMLYNARQPISNWLLGVASKAKGMNETFERIAKSLEWNPNNTGAYLYLGGIYLALGEYEDALEVINQAITIDPTNFELYGLRGEIYTIQSGRNEAIKDYTKAIKVSELNKKADTDMVSGFYNNRGDAYQQLENHQQAIADASMAIELNPYSSVAYITRGDSYKALGENKKALEDYEKSKKIVSSVLKIQPKDEGLLALLEEIDKRLEALE